MIAPATMTAKEAAAYLRICYPKLLELSASNEIPNIKIGRLYYYTKEGLDKWLEFKQSKPSKEQEIETQMRKKYPHLCV